MMYEMAKERAEEADAKREMINSKPIRRRMTIPEEEGEKEIIKRQMARCALILERMVNQNNHHDISIGIVKLLTNMKMMTILCNL